VKRVLFYPVLARYGVGLVSLYGLVSLSGLYQFGQSFAPFAEPLPGRIAADPTLASDAAFAPATAKPRPKTTAGGGSRMVPASTMHSSSAFF
jgi:hypothetical protein